jgi:hypothetical protein
MRHHIRTIFEHCSSCCQITLLNSYNDARTPVLDTISSRLYIVILT